MNAHPAAALLGQLNAAPTWPSIRDLPREYQVGLFLRRAFRTQLRRLEFLGFKAEWSEDKRLFGSTFRVYAQPRAHDHLQAVCLDWDQDL